MKNKKLIRKVWENYEPIHEKTTVDMSLPKELKLKLQADSGFFFGLRKKAENYAGKPAEMDGHILVAGGPGTGKTSGIVIPTMRTWRGSQIILDVKGDLHHYHSFFSKRLLWFSPGSEKSCRYDPFALLRQDSPDNLAGHAMDLAMALIPLASSAHEPVWTHAAQTFLAGAIVYYFKEGYSFVQAMTELQIVPIGEIMEQVMKSSDELAKSFFCKLGEVQGKVLSNIGLELCQLITFSTDKAVQSALSQVGDTPMLDWSWYSTTEEPFDVILHIPESNLDRWKSLLLMLVNQLIKSLERRPQYTGVQKRRLPPLLVMLDEFPRIGPITSIVSGLATLRSRGVTFALFVQSISDLERNLWLYNGTRYCRSMCFQGGFRCGRCYKSKVFFRTGRNCFFDSEKYFGTA